MFNSLESHILEDSTNGKVPSKLFLIIMIVKLGPCITNLELPTPIKVSQYVTYDPQVDIKMFDELTGGAPESARTFPARPRSRR